MKSPADRCSQRRLSGPGRGHLGPAEWIFLNTCDDDGDDDDDDDDDGDDNDDVHDGEAYIGYGYGHLEPAM